MRRNSDWGLNMPEGYFDARKEGERKFGSVWTLSTDENADSIQLTELRRWLNEIVRKGAQLVRMGVASPVSDLKQGDQWLATPYLYYKALNKNALVQPEAVIYDVASGKVHGNIEPNGIVSTHIPGN
jgi:hypothetical protein